MPRWLGPYPDPDLCEDGYEPEPGVSARGEGAPCRCGAWTRWRERVSGAPVCRPGCRSDEDIEGSLPSWELPTIDRGPMPWE